MTANFLLAQTYPWTLASSKKFDSSRVKGGAQFLNGVLPPPSSPSSDSNRLIVWTDTAALFARSSWDQLSKARAALICLTDTFSIHTHAPHLISALRHCASAASYPQSLMFFAERHHGDLHQTVGSEGNCRCQRHDDHDYQNIQQE